MIANLRTDRSTIVHSIAGRAPGLLVDGLTGVTDGINREQLGLLTGTSVDGR